MGRTCFEDLLWKDARLRALPAALRAAFPAVVARSGPRGEGALTDAELRAGLLGPARFARLADALISWGWMARDGAGRLARRGVLADSRASDSDSDSDS